MAKLTLDDFKGIVQHIHSIYRYDNFVEEANTWYQVWSNRGFQVNQLGFIDVFNEAVLFPAVRKAISVQQWPFLCQHALLKGHLAL